MVGSHGTTNSLPLCKENLKSPWPTIVIEGSFDGAWNPWVSGCFLVIRIAVYWRDRFPFQVFDRDMKLQFILKLSCLTIVNKTQVRLEFWGKFSGCITKSMCSPIMDKMKAKLDCRKMWLLSFAGRTELIISTLSSYRLFWSAAFPIPSSTIKGIESLCMEFLWGDADRRRKIHTVKWDAICLPKKGGGLGIRKVKDLVNAGIILSIWNIAAENESLWVRWVHGKYLLKKQSI